MVVGDHELGLADITNQIIRNETAELVVVLVILGKQDAEPVPDRQAGGDDEEPAGEARVVRLGDLVQRLPGDQHRHYDGLAGACRHLQCDPVQAEVAGGVRLVELVADPGVARLLGGLGEVDRGLGGFALREQDRIVALGVGPVLEEAAGGGRDVWVPLLRQMLTRSLTWLTKSFSRILSAVNSANSSSICWPRLRGRGTGTKYWLGRRPSPLVGYALVIELEVLLWGFVGGVDDRVIDDPIRHWWCPLARKSRFTICTNERIVLSEREENVGRHRPKYV